MYAVLGQCLSEVESSSSVSLKDLGEFIESVCWNVSFAVVFFIDDHRIAGDIGEDVTEPC